MTQGDRRYLIFWQVSAFLAIAAATWQAWANLQQIERTRAARAELAKAIRAKDQAEAELRMRIEGP
jgi:hypothetical protein